MPNIYQQGTLNTAALVVPDIFVVVVPPQNLLINGVPTSRVGVVGTATWGPVNQPVTLGSFADCVRAFGTMQARKYDLSTPIATAVQQGAQDFRAIRVTDGTDSAASGVLVANCLTLTARYSGSFGNSIVAQLVAGSKAGTWKLIVSAPGQYPEQYDNLSGAGNAFWAAAAAAINIGAGVLRGPSQLVVASAGAGTTAPTAVSGTLSGGTDGATTITAATLVGVDGTTRTGMYALRGTGCSILVLSDVDDSTAWTTVDGFALFEGMYAIQTLPSGTSISAAVTAKATAGLDSYSTKLMHGDWVVWADPVNGVQRLASPQGFVAGRLANLSPEQSSLNKKLYSVVGTQKSGQAGSGQTSTYSTADLTQLLQAGIDVIANPQPGGSYWGVRGGHNSSSNASVNGDNYTRLTNFIAATLSAGMGVYVGQLVNASLFRRIRSTQLAFLQGLLGQGILGSTDGSLPFNVICDTSNNPQSRTALGYVQSDAQVQYQAINEKFIVNLEGGQTVTVTRQTLSSGQV